MSIDRLIESAEGTRVWAVDYFVLWDNETGHAPCGGFGCPTIKSLGGSAAYCALEERLHALL